MFITGKQLPDAKHRLYHRMLGLRGQIPISGRADFPIYLFFRYQFHAIVIFYVWNQFLILTLDPSSDFLVNLFTQN